METHWLVDGDLGGAGLQTLGGEVYVKILRKIRNNFPNNSAQLSAI